ncbi:MAG: radical SAM protein [Patescibacteria group bacterium]|jgi:radical SAM protein with 4Fe4S-binding SPASM domain
MPRLLKEISIEITNQCALSCLHCSSNAGLPFERELSQAEIMDILRQAKWLGASIFTISGGELLMRKDCIDLMLYAWRFGFSVRLQTSAIYKNEKGKMFSLKEAFFDFWRRYSHKDDRIVFSLHGMKETHEKVTGLEGSFDLLMASIALAVARGLKVEVHTTVMAVNYLELGLMYDLLRDLGVKNWHLLRLVVQGSCANHPELVLNQEQFRVAQRFFSYLIPQRFDLILGHNIDRRYSYDESFPIRSCNIGQEKILIRANGDVTYCSAMKYPAFGNILENNLEYFWLKHPMVDIFRRFQSYGYKRLKGKCRKCVLLDSCKGGCLAQRFSAYNGNMLQGPDPLCFYGG